MIWARAEFQRFGGWGDARRTQRLIKLVDDLSARPTREHPQACGAGGTKAAYRLLDNPAVEWRDPGSPYHADGGADGRSAGGVAFRTRRNWISPRNRGSPGWDG